MNNNNQILDSEDEGNKSKIKKGNKKIFGLILILIGWLSLGIGYSEPLPGILNDVLFFGGLILFFGGTILMFLK